MRISNIIGWFFIAGLLLFSFLMQGKQETVSSASYSCYDQEEVYQLHSLGVATECYALSLPTLTAPFPVYYFITYTFTYHLDTYQKRFFFFRECSFFSPFLRNIYYVLISIHAP